MYQVSMFEPLQPPIADVPVAVTLGIPATTIQGQMMMRPQNIQNFLQKPLIALDRWLTRG